MTTSVRLPGLRDFIRERAPAERCELCGAELSPHPHHEHLFEPSARQFHCSCTPCAMLFPADADKRYRRVPRRLWYLEGFAMTDMQWESLAIPVNMAFLHTTSPDGAVRAYYPSPAGATESMLTLEGWEELVGVNPLLGKMVPDVEALLVNRVSGARDAYLAPIDKCYELVGLIRISWRGLSGGQEVWDRITTFFTDLRVAATDKGHPMPDLELEVVSAGAEPDTLIPILNFRVRIREREGHRIDAISLRCQIMVQATRRTYAPGEQEALLDLFGPPSRWGTTLKTMLWTHASVDVSGFTGSTEAIVPVPCTHDLTITAGKYFFALETGDVPLMFQFSGTIFWRDEEGSLQVAPISWSKEAAFRLPVATWRSLMEEHDPDSAWLCLRRDTVDKLNRYKAHSGVPGWDAALTRLLDAAEGPAITASAPA